MQNRRWVMGLCGLVVVAAWSCRAEEKPKTVDDTIPNTTVKFTMVQLPGGMLGFGWCGKID